MNSFKLPLYKQSYNSLFDYPHVQTENQFLNVSSTELKCMSFSLINKIFSHYINIHFPNFIVAFTDGSVLSLSAGY